MIRPIFFNTDAYFCQDKLNSVKSLADITPGRQTSGEKQCILQNTCSQINFSGTNWSITSIPSIKIDDAINGNYDTDCYLEMTSASWYFFKDRSWVKDKNIIITNYTESWLRGLKVSIDPYDVIDVNIIEDLKLAKHAILIRDNCSEISDITCLPFHSFYIEARNKVQNHKHGWMPWINDYENQIRNSIQKIGKKKKTFTALLGFEKPHRNDFWDKVHLDNLQSIGYIGGFSYGKFENDDFQTHPDLRDRFIARDWVENSEIWISHESHYSTLDLEKDNFCSPITEKTWKPISVGMPFLINSHPDIIKGLNDMGFDTFTSIFGDYISMDYRETNDNIIHIIKNYYSFSMDDIKQKCESNFNRFLELDQERYFAYFWNKIGVEY